LNLLSHYNISSSICTRVVISSVQLLRARNSEDKVSGIRVQVISPPSVPAMIAYRDELVRQLDEVPIYNEPERSEWRILLEKTREVGLPDVHNSSPTEGVSAAETQTKSTVSNTIFLNSTLSATFPEPQGSY